MKLYALESSRNALRIPIPSWMMCGSCFFLPTSVELLLKFLVGSSGSLPFVMIFAIHTLQMKLTASNALLIIFILTSFAHDVRSSLHCIAGRQIFFSVTR